MKQVAVVDTSWMMHLFKHALSDLSIEVLVRGVPERQPTGHLYGSIEAVWNLSLSYDEVILAVDSRSNKRKTILSGYKAGRHQVTGVYEVDYSIYNDLLSLLKIVTAFDNVSYCKFDGLESDDIIASFIDATVSPHKFFEDKTLSCYHNDADILQTPGRYSWYRSFYKNSSSREEYISSKFQLEGFDYLPVWYKVIRGDSSDKIPVALPRYPTKELISLCKDLPLRATFPEFIYRLLQSSLSSKWSSILEDISSQGVIYNNLLRNYQIVSPDIVPINDLKFKKLGFSQQEAIDEASKFQINLPRILGLE
jgi:5'-3' exonuclease